MNRDKKAHEPHARESGLSLRATFREYRSRLERRAASGPRRFRLHLLFWGAINAFLVLVNLFTGLSFPWFLFPLGGWALVLAGHLALTRQHLLEDREAAALPDLSPQQTGLFRRYHRQRSAFSFGLTSVVSTALFLAMVNLIVSPHFLWFLIVAGALGLGELSHFVAYSSARSRLLERLGFEIPAVGRPGVLSPAFALHLREGPARGQSKEVRDAERLRKEIEACLADLGRGHHSLRGELAPLLDRYVDHVRLLVTRRNEMASLLARTPQAHLTNERARLGEKLEAAQTAALRSEYVRAIEQLDGRLESIGKLHERIEIAELKLRSAIGSLEQLEADLLRMKSLSDFDGGAVSLMLERKLGELSERLDDLAAGSRELENLE